MAVDLLLTPNPALSVLDLSMAPLAHAATLALDAGLQTAVIVSLLSDRQAEPGDVLPDDDGPRGWWGDAFNGWRLGSRLWLLKRSILDRATLNLAEDYAREALRWMEDDGVAGSIDVKATAQGLHRMNLAVTITQKGAAHRFDVVWSGQADNAAEAFDVLPGVTVTAGTPQVLGAFLLGANALGDAA